MKKPINILYEVAAFSVITLVIVNYELLISDGTFCLVNHSLFVISTSSITARAYLSSQKERSLNSVFLFGFIYGLYVSIFLALGETHQSPFALEGLPAMIVSGIGFGIIASAISLVEYNIIKVLKWIRGKTRKEERNGIG